MLREYEYKKTSVLWSMPTSFGPLTNSGPINQGLGEDGTSYNSSEIKFKTSKTLLRNLLPSGRLRLTNFGSVSLASFVYTHHANVDWLGGQSYSGLSLYIHSVHVNEEKETSLAEGSFLVVSFVD